MKDRDSPIMAAVRDSVASGQRTCQTRRVLSADRSTVERRDTAM
jgi:hypothetical protein